MRAAKVVFVNRYFAPDQSATSRLLTDLAARLAERGIAVSVVTSRQRYEDPHAALPPRENVAGVQVYRVDSANRGRARLGGRALDYATFHAAASLELLRRVSPGDVVVAKTDPPLISVTASYAAKWKGVALVNWLQDVFPEVAEALTPDLLPRMLAWGLTAARDRSLRRAALNIVVSEGMRERLIARGIASTRIKVVPNWADTSRITPHPAADTLTRRRYALAARFVLGYSGNLGRAHEFDTLVGAASLLRHEPRFAFLITGAGARAEALKQAVAAEGLASFVFQPFQPAAMLGDSLAAPDVHLVSLLPELEGLVLPSKLYGVLAAGRPTIFVGDPNGEIARLLRDHDCGIAVRTGDSAQLAAELRSLSDAPARVERMGVRARELALQRYTAEHAVAEWLEVLTDIAPASITRSLQTRRAADVVGAA